MTETQYGAAMKGVVSRLHPLLKEAGFRKQRHNFNREPEAGLVHVVNFQMGPYEVGDPVEIPGLRENLYGTFTVNLGVFLDEVFAHLGTGARPKFVPEYHCEIRTRLGALMTGGREDIWWNLDRSSDVLAADVGQHLEHHGLPFLDSVASRSSILQEWYRDSDRIGFPLRGQLAVALIHWHRGERELAERLLREYLAVDHQPGHADYAREVVRSLGIDC